MKISQFASILVVITAVVTACAPAEAEAPAATEAPEEAPATEAPATSVPTCPTPSEPPPFNPDKTVSFALPELALTDPEASAVILRVQPLLDPPEIDEELLLTDECGVIIGGLIAERPLPLNDPDVNILPEGEYQVKVQQGLMRFIDTNGEEYSTSLQADIRTIDSRLVDPPETIITVKDICYSWQHTQVCTEPSPSTALTPDEIEMIQARMQNGVDRLVEQGVVNPDDVNVAGTIPDILGDNAAQLERASVLAAPTVSFPAGVDEPVDGALLGVVVVVMDIQKQGYPPLLEGTYAVFALDQDEWVGHFVPVEDDGEEAFIPATYVEVRGEIEEPLAIILDLRIILCLMQC